MSSSRSRSGPGAADDVFEFGGFPLQHRESGLVIVISVCAGVAPRGEIPQSLVQAFGAGGFDDGVHERESPTIFCGVEIYFGKTYCRGPMGFRKNL